MKVLFLPDYSTANAYQRELRTALTDLGVTVTADPTHRRRILPVLEAIRGHGRPDVLHLHWTEPYIARGTTVSRPKAWRMLTELSLIRRSGTRLVWTAHDLFRHDRDVDPQERDFLRALFGRCDAVIVHCQSAVGGLLEALGLAAAERGRVAVIPHGHYAGVYPDTIDRAEARERLGLEAGARVVAFVGWVRPYKGVAELMQAFSTLDGPGWRLVIAGRALDDGYAARLEGLAAADPRVRLDLGFVADDRLQVYLRAADVVATPFLEVFTSGSVLLAMSFGRAVIAPRRGCVADVLDDAGGLLYDAHDPDGLARALRSLAGADVEAMGLHNLDRLDAFSWARVAAATLATYERALRQVPMG